MTSNCKVQSVIFRYWKKNLNSQLKYLFNCLLNSVYEFLNPNNPPFLTRNIVIVQ